MAGAQQRQWTFGRPFEIVAALGGGVCIAIIVLLDEMHDDLIKPLLSNLDQALPAFFTAHASPFWDHIMWTLTTIGAPFCVSAFLLAALGVLALRKRRAEAIGLVMSEVGGVALNQAAKALFHRHRPSLAWAFAHERDYSFPSGHAMLGIITFGTIAFMLCRYYPRRRIRSVIVSVAALLILGIGISRIYLHAHFPSDILAGWLAGGVWLVAVIVGTRFLHAVAPNLRPPSDQPQGNEPSGK